MNIKKTILAISFGLGAVVAMSVSTSFANFDNYFNQTPSLSSSGQQASADSSDNGGFEPPVSQDPPAWTASLPNEIAVARASKLQAYQNCLSAKKCTLLGGDER